MSSAGPSQRRRRGSIDESQSQRPTQTQDGTQARRKRPRGSLREELFDKPDLEEKARIVAGYRDMQMAADDMKTNLENIGVDDLARMARQQNKLFRDVRDTGTAALDARLMMTMGETSANLARKLKLGGVSFDVSEFINNVKSVLGMEAEETQVQDDDSEEDELEETMTQRQRPRRGQTALGDWERIGWMAASLSRRAPGVEFMYGPLEVEHTVRQHAPRRGRQEIAPETRPEEVQQEGKTKTKDPTTQHVKEISQVLNAMDPQRKGVNLFRLFVNPDSFAQSVENLFYTSFLVKEGRVGIDVKDDGEIMICASDQYDPAVEGDLAQQQAVIEFDMETWQQAINTFNITESAIPHRDPPQEELANGRWYGQ